MARKTETEIRAENELLARALVQALTANNYGTDILTGTLPPGFLASFRDCLPDEFKARWQRKSMPNQWKVRKGALIPMVEALLRRPAGHSVLHENTDVLQTEEPVDVPQEHTPSYTEEPPVVIHENTGEHETARKTIESDVIQIDRDTYAELTEMLEWWRDRRDELHTPSSVTVSEAPNFGPKDSKPKTIRLPLKMVRAANKYAKQHRALTGGTFSGLVELAVWRLLGEPEELVIREDTAQD